MCCTVFARCWVPSPQARIHSSLKCASTEQSYSIHQPLVFIFICQKPNPSLKACRMILESRSQLRSEEVKVRGISIIMYSFVHVENILRKPELPNIQQIFTVSLMFSSRSMFMFRLAVMFCSHMEMPYFGPGVKNTGSVKCHISVKKKSWKKSLVYQYWIQRGEIALNNFISKEKKETREDYWIPMSRLGLRS